MALEIRDAQPDHECAWRKLWDRHVHFYRMPLDPEVTAFTWKRILDPASPVNMRVAEQDGALAGFAIYLSHPSSWVKSNDCYLDDLFIDERFRGFGIGRALLDDLVAVCKKNGWERLYWHAYEANTRARKLYDSYVEHDGHVRYRMRISK
ncbi:MAG: GNAT family N-acetyltransferase [Mesorhizobium sp.]|uniref:GNAT family N-acetyltransferase n=1 Tax=Mesorhizobium sp. TaxID=1871066 RepID=UPI000FE98AA7|nr:GNAT family N-acetyltransferase [Mesorhizobium sp.]RWH31396.1 MAG: GNAT family N-acetyltransferase [Mesorhizobium sp.]RWH38638.1 MAG: GNAT family N-acetyltransferase [Mesorhizobium sp.]TIM71016.1 MAG: GNAT family N-acetyltransferase [Mesorhizobium sp.]TIO05221.1 MAG: GNAT family N-acetyltransferase [Mesorhizobium sp.]TIR61878.1 MAG: GNAT family N-acetyltransferase [Mesorhizobium sp.]